MKQNNSLRIILSIILMALVIALVYSIARLIQMSQQPVDVKADLTAREVVVSNISGNSAVISWYSEESVESFVSYGSAAGQFTTKVLDFRDDTVPAARNLFYVKINNLLPERKYFFQITAGTETFSTPESTYTFTTLPSSDKIGVPDPILISAPDDFVEGVAYVHSSNGNNISTTASVYSTNPNITIDKSSLKDVSTGDTFNIGDGNILVAITSSNGKRANGIIKSTDSTLNLPTISATTAAYNANSIVGDSSTPVSSPVSSPSSSPGDSASNPITLTTCNSSCAEGKYCLCPSNCANPSGVYQSISTRFVCGGDKQTLPPTGSVGTPTPTPVPVPVPVPVPTPVPPPTSLPSTDVNTDMALAINVFFGIVLVTLGYQLRKSKG